MNLLTRVVASLSLLGLAYTLPYVAMAATGESTPTKLSKEAKQKVSFLFVLRADTGIITKADGGYTLMLQGMDDKVLYFSDRPVRKAGFITTIQFMSHWATGNNSFKSNPPNAAIVHAALKTNEKGIAQAIPVELISPVAVTNGWSFKLKDLQGKINVGSYKKMSVFIDYFNPGNYDYINIGEIEYLSTLDAM